MTTVTDPNVRERATLRKQIIAANALYRAAYDAADLAVSSGDIRSATLIQTAAAALRKRDALLDQWPRQREAAE